MTDKTDALVALIRKMAAHVRPTCSALYYEAIEALAAPDEGGQGEVVRLESLRTAQAAAVMPLIGPMLDAWHGLHNDDKEDMREAGLARHIQAIEEMMEDHPIYTIPPAASVDVEGLREWVRTNLPDSYADKPLIEILRLLKAAGVSAEQDLIDSAGGAKCVEVCAQHGITAVKGCADCERDLDDLANMEPQPAKGDGAVDMRTVGDHNGRLLDLDYAATCLDGCGYQFTGAEKVRRVRNWLAKLYPRPAATAVVPDDGAIHAALCFLGELESVGNSKAGEIAWGLRKLAAPKGGVVDEFDAWFDEYSKQNYTDDMLARAAWNAALANQEQRS